MSFNIINTYICNYYPFYDTLYFLNKETVKVAGFELGIYQFCVMYLVVEITILCLTNIQQYSLKQQKFKTGARPPFWAVN
jgi:hypothetical protein